MFNRITLSIEGGLALLLLFVWLFYSYKCNSLEKEVLQLTNEKNQYKDALTYQNSAILANKIDDTKAKELPEQLEKIQTRYQVVYKTIESIKEDKDETCNTAIDNLNTFTF